MKTLFKRENIQDFVDSYFKSVLFMLSTYNIPFEDVVCDHIGCLLHNSIEFDAVTNELNTYTKLIKSIELHNRRVKVFQLNDPINSGFLLPKIEIFEPKPDADFKQLRFGIEHIAFYVWDWDSFKSKYQSKLPIIKEGSVDKSLFMKTEVLNTIEIEFRNDRLGESG